MKSSKRILSVIVFLVIAQVSDAGLFQRMRLPSGVYKIPASGSRVTAICLDGAARPAPKRTDNYSSSSKSITVTRITPTGKKTLPFSEAASKWVNVHGNESATSVEIVPKTVEKDVTYELNVESGGGGVIGGNENDVAEMLSKIDNKIKHLDGLDVFTQKLEQSLGHDSFISDSVRQIKYLFESQLSTVETNEAADFSAEIVPAIKTYLAHPDLSAKERLLKLSILHGKLLTDPQIQTLRDLGIEIATADRYEAEFKDQIQEFSQQRAKLRSAFGSDEQFEHLFTIDVAKRFQSEGDLGRALRKARSVPVAIPEGLRAISGERGARDVLSLILGQRITDKQNDALRDVFNWNGGNESHDLDKCVFLTELPNGDVLSRTTESKVVEPHDRFAQQVGRMLKNRPYVVVDDTLSADVVTVLHKHRVSFVRRIESLLKRPTDSAKTVKLIFAMADDQEVNKILFEGQNTAAIARAASTARQIPGDMRAFVKSKEEFVQTLNNLRQNERGVVIFHGTDKIRFPDGEVVVSEHLNRCDALSCDTWELDILDQPVSTGKVDIELVARAAKAATSKTTRIGQSGIAINEGFFHHFAEAYQQESKKDTVKSIALKILIVGIGGSVAAVVNLLDDDDDDAPADEQNATRKSGKQGEVKKQGDEPVRLFFDPADKKGPK